MVYRRWCTQNPRWGHAGQLERKAPVGCGFAAALTETRAFPCSAPKCIFGELSSCHKRCGQFEAVRFLGPEWHSRSTATSRDIDIQWPNWTGSILVAATIRVKSTKVLPHMWKSDELSPCKVFVKLKVWGVRIVLGQLQFLALDERRRGHGCYIARGKH